MIYYGLDIGGNTGFTAFDTIKQKMLVEKVVDTRDLTEEQAAETIINLIAETRLRYSPNDKINIVSEQFIASRTMKADVFRSARIESMVRFWVKMMEQTRYNYDNQPPQKRLPFVNTARTWVKASTKEGRCHIVDSFAHILASLHDKGIKIPANHKTVKKQRELNIEDYEGGFKL